MAADPKLLAQGMELLRGVLVKLGIEGEIQLRNECYLVFNAAARDMPLACYLQLNPEMPAVLFRASLVGPVPAEHRGAVMEYFTRANYEIPAGCLALDLDTGQVRYKSTLYFGNTLSEELVGELVASSFQLMEPYMHGAVELAVGEPLEAVLARGMRNHPKPRL
jgi:hypothetical protein